MTAALRLQGVVSGSALAMPELSALEGKRVEIVVTEIASPIAAPRRVRKLGALRGQIAIADDFDAPLPPELLDGFAGTGS